MTATWSIVDITTTFYSVASEEMPLFSWEDFRSEPQVTPRYPRYTKPEYMGTTVRKKRHMKMFTGHNFRIGRGKK